jgi:hypothetical protein
MQVHQASGLFGFTGLLTVFIVGLPVIVYSVFVNNHLTTSWIGLIGKRLPSFTPTVNELFAISG